MQDVSSMQLLITGATGLIGRRLVEDRLRRGDCVIAVTRNAEKARAVLPAIAAGDLRIIQDDPTRPGPWQATIDECDAVVNFAGASIADRRWSASYKKILRSSRIDSAAQVVAAIRMASNPPRIFISSSAIGYYGETGPVPAQESDPPGEDFLARLCADWEAIAREAESEKTRVVTLRYGIVLDERGGALGKMLTPFRFFLGGPIGSGKQAMTWIHWEDVISLIDFVLENEACQGPYNAVSPQSITNREFCRILGRTLRRPCWLPAPKFALRLVLGEFARYVSMSQRVSCEHVIKLGYDFRHPDLETALASLFFQNGDKL
ncbi:MAG: TIGR01777 family protein [Planctomycetes bacterium]|nr:TIGR01777 family protein [Planctomycetota bacterium]